MSSKPPDSALYQTSVPSLHKRAPGLARDSFCEGSGKHFLDPRDFSCDVTIAWPLGSSSAMLEDKNRKHATGSLVLQTGINTVNFCSVFGCPRLLCLYNQSFSSTASCNTFTKTEDLAKRLENVSIHNVRICSHHFISGK